MIDKIVGGAVVFGCLVVIYLFESSNSMTGAFRVLHWPAILLTGVGPFGLVLLCAGREQIFSTFRSLRQNSPIGMQKRLQDEANFLHDFSHNFYKQGFQNQEYKNGSPELDKAMRRFSMGMPVADILELTEKDRKRDLLKFNQSNSLLGLGMRMSPSIGMLGTILGMVHLLASLQDPSKIGSHMSLALLTTFFGLFFSLVMWTPLHYWMKSICTVTMVRYDQIVHCLELLVERKPAQYFADSMEMDSVPRTSASANNRVQGEA